MYVSHTYSEDFNELPTRISKKDGFVGRPSSFPNAELADGFSLRVIHTRTFLRSIWRDAQRAAHDADIGSGREPIVIFTMASASRGKPSPRLPGLLPGISNTHDVRVA